MELYKPIQLVEEHGFSQELCFHALICCWGTGIKRIKFFGTDFLIPLWRSFGIQRDAVVIFEMDLTGAIST